MGRITRAKAAEVAEKLHIDEDAVLELPSDAREVADGLMTPEPRVAHRTPLGELAPNSGGSGIEVGEDVKSMPVESVEKKTKGKKGGKKANASVEVVEEELPQDAMSEKNDSAMSGEHLDSVSSATTTAEDLTTKEEATKLEMSHEVQNQDMTPTSPSNDEDEDSTHIQLGESIGTPVLDTMPNTMQRSISPIAAAPSTPQTSSIDMTGSKYDELEAAVIQAATPPRSMSKADSFQSVSKATSASPLPQLSQDSITALDALDDAVDKVNAEVPEIQPSPVKPKPKNEKAAPVVRATKASQARLSIAHGPKDAARAPALGRPRQSIAAGDGRRVTSNSSIKSNGAADDTEPPARQEIVIPHSKPRPMSMSFPAPRPPPKSTKAPTQINFTLPGEAMSAKFKAAREARALKEAEEAKKRVFKARPAPSMVGKTPVVRQTSTSKARESMIGGKPLVPSATHNRANSVASSRPATTTLKTSVSRPAPAAMAKKSTAPAKDVKVPKRASTAMGVLNKASRTSISAAAANRPPSVSRAPSAGQGTSKGKEVFSRTAQAKSTAEREKREKEEAAKKARAEAAERSRALSREWAEKQKAKKSGMASAKAIAA